MPDIEDREAIEIWSCGTIRSDEWGSTPHEQRLQDHLNQVQTASPRSEDSKSSARKVRSRRSAASDKVVASEGSVE